ncbi:MAG: glyoxalase [Acidobacteria bacterium]|nr:MAG: glyoxalase [Acidobacteriota bacterium]
MSRRLVMVLLFWFCLSLTAFAEEPKMNLSKIAQISVRAKDLQRATAFYRDTLELKIIVSTPVISIAECGGVFLLISKAETPELDHPSSVIYFDVDDIQKTTADLSSRNVKIDDKPHIVGQLGNQDVWVAIFRDSEDNLVGLISRTPRK